MQPENLSFRTMTIRDIPQLVNIDAASNSPFWSDQMFARELELPFSLSLLVEFHRKAVGFGICWLLGDKAQINQLAVSPEYRRQGAGERLVKELSLRARDSGCKRMELEFKEGNEPAFGLYQKCGFKIVGKRKNFYPDCDAILMECNL